MRRFLILTLPTTLIFQTAAADAISEAYDIGYKSGHDAGYAKGLEDGRNENVLSQPVYQLGEDVPGSIFFPGGEEPGTVMVPGSVLRELREGPVVIWTDEVLKSLGDENEMVGE